MIINIPRKTFCIGEYGVLDNGQALVINHGPSYKISIKDGKVPPYLSYFGDINKELIYDKDKGFGSSSAEFIAYYYLKYKNLDIAKMHTLYKNIFPNTSGADLISQLTGKIALVNLNPMSFSSLDWKFENLDFCIIKTGQSIKTHEHLKQIKIKNIELLKAISAKGISAFVVNDEYSFIGYINLFYQQLLNENLVMPQTQEIIKELKMISGVKAIKGCGAYGAESILCIYEKDESDNILKKLANYPSFNSHINLSKAAHVLL